MKPLLDLEKFDEEIIKELNRLQPHDLQTEITIFKKIIRQHIREACDFYLRYKDHPEFLLSQERWVWDYCSDHGERIGDIIEKSRKPLSEVWKSIWWDEKHYNGWLFKLTFGSV